MTTGVAVTVATSNAANTIKTMMQVKTGAGKIRIVEWGYEVTATPTAPILYELIETALIGGTMTAAGVVLPYNDVTGPATQTAAPGTASTGYNATAEGTIVATRLFAQKYDFGTYFVQQFPQGREPEVNANSFVRIRATPTVALASQVSCYMVWEE
jgi:hypothetical protein